LIKEQDESEYNCSLIASDFKKSAVIEEKRGSQAYWVNNPEDDLPGNRTSNLSHNEETYYKLSRVSYLDENL
jgi:hypothetical protein